MSQGPLCPNLTKKVQMEVSLHHLGSGLISAYQRVEGR